MTKALNEQCILQFDEVAKWEVKDVCYWLDAVSSYDSACVIYFLGAKNKGSNLLLL